MADERPILRLASTVTIDEMELSTRSYNCLKAASIDTLEDLLTWSPEQLKKLPHFGRKCLDEVVDIVHRLGFRSFGEATILTERREFPSQEESAPLACLLQLRELFPEGTLQERLTKNGWHDVADLSVHDIETIVRLAGLSTKQREQFEETLHSLSLELPIKLPLWLLYHISALRTAFRVELEHLIFPSRHRYTEINSGLFQATIRSLNEDLSRLIPKAYNMQKRQVVSDLLGLEGRDPLTLEEVAQAQKPPITRERVRQIAKPITDALANEGHKLPSLLKAISTLKRITPCRVNQAEQALQNEGILDTPLTVSAILGLAHRSTLEHSLVIEGGAILDPDTAEFVARVVRAAGKLSSHWGVADWQEIEQLIPEAARLSTKELLHDVVWLDADKRYLVLPNRENSLANRLVHILTVAPRIKLTDAYQGAFRDARMEKDRLPEELFAAFCRVWPWCSIVGDDLVAGLGLPSSDASGDDLLVLLLREIGQPVKRRQLIEQATKEGLSEEVVTRALSYSNVIASANGYFAVIGDARLADWGRTAEAAPAEVLQATRRPDDAMLVPDACNSDFAGLLMLAVEERIEKLRLRTPWSMSELRLRQLDRDQLFAWGHVADWDFHGDFSNYQAKSGEKVRKRTALGLAFLLFASEAVRRFGDSGSVWPAIEQAMGDRQQKLFMVRAGIPKPTVREAVEDACRTFGLRHGFEDVGQQVWVRTFVLQSGLLSSQLSGLCAMLAEPAYLRPLAIQLLLDVEGPNASESFQESWKLLQDVRLGIVSERVALERFRSDAWLLPFPADELLSQCLATQHECLDDTPGLPTAGTDDVYRYFSAPTLKWAIDEVYLEYRLNVLAPPWRECAALIFFCDDPFRRERIPIENGHWQLADGPVRVPLTQRGEPGFRFKLMQGKEEVFADWMYAGFPQGTPFTFFRSSGVMITSADDVPQGEELLLLHSVEVQVTGFDAPPVFRVVLRGTYRLTRIPPSILIKVQLIGRDGRILWKLPSPDETVGSEAEPILSIHDGKWGTAVVVTLPELPFIPERLRLNNGELLPIMRTDGRAYLLMSPRLGRAQTGRVLGSANTCTRSVRVRLNHIGSDSGAALETSEGWQPLDGLATLDAATLRTHRLLARVKARSGTDKDVCWMEGSRAVAGWHMQGTVMAGLHGLGESLNVVRGTYNSSRLEVPVASAVTDGGFWHSLQHGVNRRWCAHLPFEDSLEKEHKLWVWAKDSLLPRELPRRLMEKTGFTLQWSGPANVPVFGWAFSFAGARVGSVVHLESLNELMQHLSDVPWYEAAMWLRWWHVPVLHGEVRDVVAYRVCEDPVETLRAWLLPAPEGSGLIFDVLCEEAWAATAREFLWGWKPDTNQSVELVRSLKIWTGDIGQDSQYPSSRETVGLLARMSPILLADVIMQALPTLYKYPKPQLAVLLGMVLEAINPNAAQSGFRLDDLCERYATGESRLDGRFILTSLVGAAHALLRGEPQDLHNLRIAFHQQGLRELISIALLRDVFNRWQRGAEN
jgi:hypothetical protein